MLWGRFAFGHAFGVRVQRVQKVRPAFGRLVQRERFLGWTGLTAGGFLSLTGPLAPRVADCPSVYSEHILKER